MKNQNRFIRAGAMIILAFLSLVAAVIFFSSFFYLPIFRAEATKECSEENMCERKPVIPGNGKCGNMADVSATVGKFLTENENRLSVKNINPEKKDECFIGVDIFYDSYGHSPRKVREEPRFGMPLSRQARGFFFC